jgi:hypothetical protein
MAYWNIHQIQIRPGITGLPLFGGATAQPSGTQTVIGGNALITLDPTLTDKSIVVQNRAGREIAQPVYMILTHELIHALRITSGQFQIGPANDPAYIEIEEEIAISSGYPSENDARFENYLELRYGIGGRRVD